MEVSVLRQLKLHGSMASLVAIGHVFVQKDAPRLDRMAKRQQVSVKLDLGAFCLSSFPATMALFKANGRSIPLAFCSLLRGPIHTGEFVVL